MLRSYNVFYSYFMFRDDKFGVIGNQRSMRSVTVNATSPEEAKERAWSRINSLPSKPTIEFVLKG